MKKLSTLLLVVVCLFLKSCGSPSSLENGAQKPESKKPPSASPYTPEVRPVSPKDGPLNSSEKSPGLESARSRTPREAEKEPLDELVEAQKKIEEAVELQRKLVAQNPSNEVEKKKLVMLYLVKNRFPDAEDLLGSLKEKDRDELAKIISAYLHNVLGEHKIAKENLSTVLEKWTEADGIAIAKLELCKSVEGFRRYEPYSSQNAVKPGSQILLYIEPQGFALRKNGDKYQMHLSYKWELLDKEGNVLPITSWQKSPSKVREDLLEFNQKVREFYQSFKLPLPRNLPMGKYHLKVTVEDKNSDKSAASTIEMYVTEY